MNNRKAFTLIEILMVMLIVWLLAWVLFKTYITISQISFRVEQQKIINQELLFVSEMMQNFANRNKINYDQYVDLENTRWIVDTLYMTWEDGIFSIYSSGDCIDLNDVPTFENINNWCDIILNKNWDIINLTNHLIYSSKAVFKIIPFAESESYFENPNLCDSNYLACVNDHGFWFFAKFYTKWYNPESWTNNVQLFIQQFFNI
jgi:prepilin-type N-terminal cleavage/methylation domain-containing protein